MISASKAFKEKLKKGANVVNYADITLSDGTVLHLEPQNFMAQNGCTIEDKTTDGKFGVGFCIGKTLTLRIANHDERFSQYDFYSSIINLYVALLLDNGTVEKIRKGVYYTIVPETPGDIIEISAVDGMFKLDRDYSASNTTYPATLQRIISDACLDCGIPIGFTQFDNMSYTVKEKPEQGTYRQILSYACQIAGYNARIDNNGSMQLVWYNTSLLDAYNYNGGGFHNYPHDTVVNGGNFTNYGTNTILSGGSFTDVMPEHIFKTKSVNIHTDDVQITGVRVSGQEEKTALFGEEGYLIEVKENPFSNGKEQVVANYLGERMVGMVFRPFSAEVLNNPLYEPFDVVRVSDVKGNVYYSLLNSVSYKIGSYTTVACEAEDPVRNGSQYVSAAAQAVVEARRNTEKQLTTYDKAVQNMNQLTANSMGLFTASEKTSDGGSIFYQSTKPITVDSSGKCHFEAGSTVYKKQGEGFFVSRDGGKTYSSGFDADGNAVLNVLNAIGINADWINAGEISADRIYGGMLAIGGVTNGITLSGKQLSFNVDGEEYGFIRPFQSASSSMIKESPGINISSDYGAVTFRINSSSKEQPKVTYSVMEILSYEAHKNRYPNSANYNPLRMRHIYVQDLTVKQTSSFGDSASFYGSIGVSKKIRNPGVEMHSGGTAAIFYNSTLYESSSSSKRYKKVIRKMNDSDIEEWYGISPMIAMYKPEYLSTEDERYGKEFPMFIAENVEKYAPLAVDHDEKGRTKNWNYKIMIPAMFQMLKSQKETIDNQQTEIESLTARIERLEALLLKGDK